MVKCFHIRPIKILMCDANSWNNGLEFGKLQKWDLTELLTVVTQPDW